MRGRPLAIVGGLLASLALTAPADAQQFSPGSRSLGDRLMPALGNGGHDALHYTNTFKYDPAANTMLPGSQTEITLKATQNLSEFALDLRAYTVSEVTIDGVPAGIARAANDKLVVTPAAGIVNGREFKVLVKFSGTPLEIEDPDGSFEGWSRIATGGFVVNEPQGAMGWFPSNNYPSDKATYDYFVTIPATHTSIANGEPRRTHRQRRRHEHVALVARLPDGHVPDHGDRRRLRLPQVDRSGHAGRARQERAAARGL